MTFSGCDISIPRQLSTAVHFPICRTQSPEELGRVGERLLGWTDCRAATLTFFFSMLTRRRRGLGERGDKILCWRHSNCTHYDACRRETAWVFPETLRRASRKTERPFQAQSVTVQTRPVSSRSVHAWGFPRRLFLSSPFSGRTNGAQWR